MSKCKNCIVGMIQNDGDDNYVVDGLVFIYEEERANFDRLDVDFKYCPNCGHKNGGEQNADKG